MTGILSLRALPFHGVQCALCHAMLCHAILSPTSGATRPHLLAGTGGPRVPGRAAVGADARGAGGAALRQVRQRALNRHELGAGRGGAVCISSGAAVGDGVTCGMGS